MYFVYCNGVETTIGIARIFTVEVHCIVASNGDLFLVIPLI